MTLPVDDWHKRVAVVGFGLASASVRRRIRAEDLAAWSLELQKLSSELLDAADRIGFTSPPSRRTIKSG